MSPKRSTEIPGDYVNLKAEGVTQEVFQSSYEWVPVEGGEAIQGEPLKYRVKRDATGKIVVKIVRKSSETVVDLMNVWIVWASGAPRREGHLPLNTIPATPGDTGGAKFSRLIGPGENSSLTWSFRFTITPAHILYENDRPKLSSAFSPLHPVPGANKPCVLGAGGKTDSATYNGTYPAKSN